MNLFVWDEVPKNFRKRIKSERVVLVMSARTAKANGRKLKDRAKVEHVFAQQKVRMGQTIRTVGLARAKAAITMANIAYNMGRLRWLPLIASNRPRLMA